jgi:hypothetical protein
MFPNRIKMSNFFKREKIVGGENPFISVFQSQERRMWMTPRAFCLPA